MSSNVPARVAAGSAQADQQLADLAAQLNAAAAPGTPPADPPPAPAAAAEPPAEPPADPPPAPQPVQPVNDEFIRRLQAQNDSNVGRIEQLSADRARLEEEVARLRNAPPAAPPAPAPTRQVTDSDLQEYGEDTISMMRRVVADETRELREQAEVMRKQLAAMDGRVQRAAETATSVAEYRQQTESERYTARLTDAVPDWEAINMDLKFEEWLSKKDQFSGRKRHDLLLEAHRALDAGRVAAIFTAYKQGLENGAPAAPARTSPDPAVDPTSQVAPRTTSAAPAPASTPAGKVYTQKEYDDMHDALLKKRIPKTEFEAFEREYYLAVAEGRVRVV